MYLSGGLGWIGVSKEYLGDEDFSKHRLASCQKRDRQGFLFAARPGTKPILEFFCYEGRTNHIHRLAVKILSTEPPQLTSIFF